MARKCRDQMVLPGFAPDNIRAEPLLERPLSPEERRRIDRLYRENIRLVYKCQHEMALRFPSISRERINACVDDGFTKAARVHDPERGRLSTRFYVDAYGECTHWLRAHGYGVSAPGKVRELGGKLRHLMGQGLTTEQALRELNVGRKVPHTLADAKDALVATAGIAHEINNWEAHSSPLIEERPSRHVYDKAVALIRERQKGPQIAAAIGCTEWDVLEALRFYGLPEDITELSQAT